jgi:hypothetical protein
MQGVPVVDRVEARVEAADGLDERPLFGSAGRGQGVQ